MAVDVTYWSDPLCIWAYLAQDKLDALVNAFGSRVRIKHRVVPVFGSVPWRFAEGNWKDAGPEGRRAATVRVARRFGHEEVTGDGWVTDAPASSWTVGAAVEACAILEEVGAVPEGSAGAYGQALRHAFFVDAKNTARRTVQSEVAAAQGLCWADLETVLNDGRADAKLWEAHLERERLGIQGSPTWVFDGGRGVLYGNVSEGVLRATLDELVLGEEPGQSRC